MTVKVRKGKGFMGIPKRGAHLSKKIKQQSRQYLKKELKCYA